MPRPGWGRRVIPVCRATRKREYVRVDDVSVDSLRGELALLAARFTPPGGFRAPGPGGSASEQFTVNLVDAVSQILFRADPARINFEINADEYDPEAEAIVTGLPNAHSPEDVQVLAHETFVQWFDWLTAGDIDRYAAVASEIWNLWRSHRYRSSL